MTKYFQKLQNASTDKVLRDTEVIFN